MSQIENRGMDLTPLGTGLNDFTISEVEETAPPKTSSRVGPVLKEVKIENKATFYEVPGIDYYVDTATFKYAFELVTEARRTALPGANFYTQNLTNKLFDFAEQRGAELKLRKLNGGMNEQRLRNFFFDNQTPGGFQLIGRGLRTKS